MIISQKGIDLIKRFEGYSAAAYPDPATNAEPYTIGWGTTVYPNGDRVKLGDILTMAAAESYLKNEVAQKTNAINNLVTSTINQNQFDSLASFAYNLGVGNLKKSTLLKKVNANPSDTTIRNEFTKWSKANGKPMKGLVIRRNAEANLYFL